MPRIYQTPVMGEAHIRAAIVHSESEADILVYRASSWGMAHGEAYWFITRNKQDADVWMFFTDQGFAQLKVYFVETRGQAQWNKPHRLRGKLRGRF